MNQSSTSPSFPNPICDFCEERPVITVYDTAPFSIATDNVLKPTASPIPLGDRVATVDISEVDPSKGPIFPVDSGWLACATCTALIEAGERELLADRALRNAAPDQKMRAQAPGLSHGVSEPLVFLAVHQGDA